MPSFGGYISRRAWARAKARGLWRFLRRFPGEARRAIRHVWWRWSHERDRVIKERDEWKKAAEFRFEQMRQASHVAYMLQCPPCGSGGALQLAADEISREGPNSPCEHAWQEGDTGAWNCEAERRGEICWCTVADELRQLDRALELGVPLNLEIAETARMGPTACR